VAKVDIVVMSALSFGVVYLLFLAVLPGFLPFVYVNCCILLMVVGGCALQRFLWWIVQLGSTWMLKGHSSGSLGYSFSSACCTSLETCIL
jgi:hypothetical protein